MMIDLLINVSCVCGIIFVCALLLYLLALGFMELYESWLKIRNASLIITSSSIGKKKKGGG